MPVQNCSNRLRPRRHWHQRLAISPLGAIPYLYGPDSFARHCEAAQQAGLNVQILRRQALAFDVDTPDDFEQMKDIGRGRISMLLEMER
ncbi:MAG: hypothetical protein WB586_18445 [Chthoniobacterales bacterium]